MFLIPMMALLLTAGCSGGGEQSILDESEGTDDGIKEWTADSLSGGSVP